MPRLTQPHYLYYAHSTYLFDVDTQPTTQLLGPQSGGQWVVLLRQNNTANLASTKIHLEDAQYNTRIYLVPSVYLHYTSLPRSNPRSTLSAT